MATSRSETPPVNLKERIAALQQRNVSPNTHQSAQATPRGLPGAGTGGLRDKIAKFEEKGGVPVPRGSFGTGAPQLAENAPPRKRGELYGNRLPGLGRPGVAPVGRSSAEDGSSEESPGARKRCISTGAALSNPSSTRTTDEPVPALPVVLTAQVPRRNSLAINFGSGRRVMSTTDPGSSSSLVPEKLPESPSLATNLAVEATLSEVEESQPPEPPSQANPVDAPVLPVHTASQTASQSRTAKQGSIDGHESGPHSSVSHPSPLLPTPASSVSSSVPVDTPPASPTPSPARAGSIVVSLSTSPLEEVTEQVDASQGIPVPNPTASVSPTIPTPNPSAVARSQSKPSFKAVVHRKVSDPPVVPAPSSLAPSVTQSTQRRRGAGGNSVQLSPSPGYGDLAVLLEDAALLELRLTDGDGLPKEVLATTPTSATFQPDPRQASASTLTEHAHIPLTDSSSQSGRSVSIPSIREPLVDGEIPEGDETDGRSLASTTFSQRSPSHRKYLSNIYRLTGRRSSSYIQGGYPRDSMSVSSEDSSSVTTPSDNGKRKGFGIPWPSGSPKRGGPNVGRSTSFADKIFNRNRTRSNVSTADQASERNSLYEPSQPTLSLSFHSELLPETDARPTSWISPGDSNSEFSPTSSLLDKEIFDAFPSVPQTLPPGFQPDAETGSVGRASTLPVTGRKQINQRLSIM